MADRYVRATGGTDSGAAATFAAGWATLQYAFDNVSAGDTMYICSTSGSKFTITTAVDIDTTSGTDTAPITCIGADLTDGSPYDGAGQAYITTASNITTLFNVATAMHHYHWKDIYFDGGGSGKASYCIYNATNSNDAWVWHNCRFTNASSHCVYVNVRGRTDTAWTMSECEIDLGGRGGSGAGLRGTTLNRCMVNLLFCKIHDNDEEGASIGVDQNDCMATIFGTMFYDNGERGLEYWGGTSCIIVGNVFAFNTDDGMWIFNNNAKLQCCRNNISRSNGAYGYNTNTGTLANLVFMDYNCSSNNTSGHIDINGGTLPGNNNVLADPKFTSETDGSEDFTLQSDSPCIDTGWGYNG